MILLRQEFRGKKIQTVEHTLETLRAMRAAVEPEGGWGPTRTWIITLEHLGYQVTEYRAGGRSVLEITG
jgi:hypothetical protein